MTDTDSVYDQPDDQPDGLIPADFIGPPEIIDLETADRHVLLRIIAEAYQAVGAWRWLIEEGKHVPEEDIVRLQDTLAYGVTMDRQSLLPFPNPLD